MKYLLLEIALIAIFLIFKFSHVIFRSFGNLTDFVADNISNRSLVCRKIISYMQKDETSDAPYSSYSVAPLFTDTEIQEMAIQAFSEFKKIPGIIDLQNYFDISSRQAKKIRDMIVNEYQRQMEQNTFTIHRMGSPRNTPGIQA